MASRYWIGGNNIWSASDTSVWSSITGGVSGATVPGAADQVFFDNGGGTNWTATLNYSPTIGNLTITDNRLNLDNNNLTVSFFNISGTSARGIDFGPTGRITIPTGGTGTVIANATIGTNLTFTGSRDIYFTYAGSTSTRQIRTCAIADIANAHFGIYITGGSDAINITGSSGLVAGNVSWGTWSGSAPAFGYYYGSLTLSPNMTVSGTPSAASFLNPNGVTQTITCNGKTIDSPVTINCPTSTVVFADNFTMAATRTLTLTAGTLNFNDKIANITFFTSSASSNRALAFGNTSIVNITGSANTVWNTSVTTNLTVTGNAVVNFTFNGNTGTRVAPFGTLSEANSISVDIGSATDSFQLGGSIKNLDTTGFTGTFVGASRTVYGNLILDPGLTVQPTASTWLFASTSGVKTITTNGEPVPVPLTFNGLGGTWQLQDNLDMTTGGNVTTVLVLQAGTLDLNDRTVSAPILTLSGSNTKGLAFGNSGVLNVTAATGTVWSGTSATGFSYTGNGIVNFTNQVGTLGSRTISHGTVSGGSILTKAPPMDFATGTLAVSVGGYFTELDFTGFTGSLSASARTMYGNIIFDPAMTVSPGGGVTTFSKPNATTTLVTNGVEADIGIAVNNGNGVFQLTSPLSTVRALTVTSGTFDANGQTINVGNFDSNNANPRTINISGVTVTVNASAATPWNITNSTNANLITANSTVAMYDPAPKINARAFAGGEGLIYNNVIVGGANAVANTVTFSGNSTFNSLSCNTTNFTKIFRFTANTTTTVNTWDITGSAGNIITITSATSVPHNLVYTGAGNVNVSYANISYSNASPADTWFSLFTNNNTDSGNNIGWVFELPSATSSNFFLVF
jgi:hypothetical protein